MKKLIIVNIITLVVLAAAGIGGYYYYDQATNYIKTDNAKIDGQQLAITAPANGKLEEWNGDFGKTYGMAPRAGRGRRRAFVAPPIFDERKRPPHCADFIHTAATAGRYAG